MRELTAAQVFDGLASVGSGDGVVAVERAGLGLATLMVRRGRSGELLTTVKKRFGIELHDAPVQSKFDRTSFIGTGYGKWLAVFDIRPMAFVEDLQQMLEGLASVADQSHAFGILRLSGPALLSTLEKGVRIDLNPDEFPVGRAAVIDIAHIGANLWKVDDTPTFDIAVTRSLAGSFCHWLEASAAIHGLVVHRRPL